MATKGFYITTPIFYPNGAPHVGHAYTVTITDIVARYHRLIGDEVYFLVGTDENSAKVVRVAEKAGKDPKVFTDKIVSNFKRFFEELESSHDQFIRTSDKKQHWPGAQEMWKKLVAAGDIYKSTYKGLYCVGAESFVTEKELVDGKCPDHDELPQVLEEENYFFKLSKYTDRLQKMIEKDELEIVPETRKKEILSLIKDGLEDISFSRPKKNIPWGIPVPDDSKQTIYVWCDALTNYISALGFGGDDDSLFRRFWPAEYHVIGKDILRFHTAIWPAMLLSAGLPLPKRIFVHGMILSGGRKMSKTLGNVLDPKSFIASYGTDALRYYLAREISPSEDGDMTEEKFKEAYNANLANGLGNLVSRVMKMATTYNIDWSANVLENPQNLVSHDPFVEYREHFEAFRINEAADFVWTLIGFMDAYITDTEPFKTIEEDEDKAKQDVEYLVERLWEVAVLLIPFMPSTAETIQNAIKNREMPKALFARK